MQRAFQHIQVEHRGDVACVSLTDRWLDEAGVREMAEELLHLILDQGCRKLALCLGPQPLDCLYSVFLAKLVTVRRHLLERGGLLKLCAVHPETMKVFAVCRLDEYFEFCPTREAAVEAMATGS